MNTLDNNKLIAEFMQSLEDGLYLDGLYFFAGGYYDTNMEFHTSWDWLMPVVEKIEGLGYTIEKNYQPIDRDWQCLIVKGNDILHQQFDRKSLNASYNVVVDFINWYNKNKKA